MRVERIGLPGSVAEERMVFDSLEHPRNSMDSEEIIGTSSINIKSPDLYPHLTPEEEQYIQSMLNALDIIMGFAPARVPEQNNIFIPLFKPWLALCAPPEKKMLTWPVSEPAKIAGQPLSGLGLFWKKDKELLGIGDTEPKCQEDSGKRFG